MSCSRSKEITKYDNNTNSYAVPYNQCNKLTAQATGGYRCPVCDMIFNSLSDLDAHIKEKHNSTEEINT